MRLSCVNSFVDIVRFFYSSYKHHCKLALTLLKKKSEAKKTGCGIESKSSVFFSPYMLCGKIKAPSTLVLV